MLPTVLAAAQMNPGRKLDGVNLLPYVTGTKTHRPHELMHWQLSHWFAVRRGDWKYVVDRDGEGLFNLEVDEEESIDLRDQQPKIVKELLSIHQAWSDALPDATCQTEVSGLVEPRDIGPAQRRGVSGVEAVASIPEVS